MDVILIPDCTKPVVKHFKPMKIAYFLYWPFKYGCQLIRVHGPIFTMVDSNNGSNSSELKCLLVYTPINNDLLLRCRDFWQICESLS